MQHPPPPRTTLPLPSSYNPIIVLKNPTCANDMQLSAAQTFPGQEPLLGGRDMRGWGGKEETERSPSQARKVKAQNRQKKS